MTPYRALLVLCLLLPACSQLKITPLKSKPPYSKIVVNKPFKFGNILTIEGTMPAGTYRPAREGFDGYFYEAPRKVIGYDLVAMAMDGGLFLERGKSRPEMMYVFRPGWNIPGMTKIPEEADLTMYP